MASDSLSTNKMDKFTKSPEFIGEESMDRKNLKMIPSFGRATSKSCCRKERFSSIFLFLCAILIVNLCPFNQEFQPLIETRNDQHEPTLSHKTLMDFRNHRASATGESEDYLNQMEYYLKFIRLLIGPTNLVSRKAATIMQAEAKVLGKMAKMWYIKKKIKKLGKKLKKHTIAVPVFTAIPIYEHAYHPQPYHLAHHVPAPIPMHHHHAAAAASSYSPVAVSQMAAAAAVAAAARQQPGHQYMASASNQQQQVAAYRIPTQLQQQATSSHHASPTSHIAQATIVHPIPAANQIINAYIPSPALFVDELGSLYGHYGNAYGRYDGGYQIW